MQSKHPRNTSNLFMGLPNHNPYCWAANSSIHRNILNYNFVFKSHSITLISDKGAHCHFPFCNLWTVNLESLLQYCHFKHDSFRHPGKLWSSFKSKRKSFTIIFLFPTKSISWYWGKDLLTETLPWWWNCNTNAVGLHHH